MIDSFIKFGIKALLRNLCKEITINKLEYNIKNNSKTNKLTNLRLEAEDIVFRYIYLKHLIINIDEICLHFSFNKKKIFFNDFNINASIIIDEDNLKEILLEKKWKFLKDSIEMTFLENCPIDKLNIFKDQISFQYSKDKITNIILVFFCFEQDKIFLKDSEQNKKMYLPMDPNIKFNNLRIKDKEINIELSSKVNLDG